MIRRRGGEEEVFGRYEGISKIILLDLMKRIKLNSEKYVSNF